jgi:predicted small secreted protein
VLLLLPALPAGGLYTPRGIGKDVKSVGGALDLPPDRAAVQHDLGEQLLAHLAQPRHVEQLPFEHAHGPEPAIARLVL